jgi:Fe-S cluster assembly scaffold protein SufB
MSNLKLNETPVRTSRNFNINNIKLDNADIPEKISEFNGLEITKTQNIKIELETDKSKLTYGLGEYFFDQILNKSNKNIKITIDGSDNENAYIDFRFSEQNSDLVSYLQIEAHSNCNANLIIKFESDEDVKAFNNTVINTNAEENANLSIIVVNLLNQKSSNFLSIENKLMEKANVKYTIIDLGGKYSITNYFSNQIGEESDNILNSMYLGNNNQVFDLNYIAEQRGAKSNIDINVQGALADQAKKHFKGTIDFKKGCKKATGNENESCTLLSETAKSLALPMLLCSEEEVEGNHSSSAGKIENKELFYIMSRGFSLKEAQKLIVKAKFNKIIENIYDDGLKAKILEEIDKKLDS